MASKGGGIYSPNALTLANSTIIGNSANYGAGLFNTGQLVVTNSTFSGNLSTVDGGGLNNNIGTASIANSTFSGNAATRSGGGITTLSTLNLTNSTIAGGTVVSPIDPLLGPLQDNGGPTVTRALLSQAARR